VSIVEATAGQYHADELGDQPTLSKSVMSILLEKSPAHARWNHPRLNPAFERKEDDKFALGTVAHQVFLEGLSAVAVIPYDDWRKQDAKDLRDEAKANGLIPLLAKDFERVEAMIVAVRSWLTLNHPTMFVAGKPEQTVTWTDRGVACRARLDWLLDDQSEIHDLKSTSRSANPESWCRSTLFSIGADVQAAFYGRGIEAITGTRPDFKFAVCELEPPHAVSVIAMGPDVLTLAGKKIDYALELWRRCLERDEWPAYTSQVAYADLPPWEESRWLAREVRELGEVAA
jgi:PDDEXK-like uncharacterized protein DUF3799